MTGEELQRYSRHILMREIGGTGQRRLTEARVLVIGAGGLGAPALMYLAAAGAGHLTVMDGDVVELSNLQRQIIHLDAVGQNKALSAADTLRRLNPHVEVTALPRHFEDADDVAGYDLVLDGSDSFATRQRVNRACLAAGVPLISAALTQWEGQLGLFGDGAACYTCVFPEEPAAGLIPTCAEAGVLGPLPGILGAAMAAEAVKHLTGAGETLRNRLWLHDALYGDSRTVTTRRRPDCAACGTGALPRG
ncbi:HesA/MoeB/ThiF family protein [Falsirhodobacter algicola]|uniref:Molybdopterin-synthase adenylyltransferase n=1 Tax=Falsirhodobacter algicola TaxID=2692330 RepID=A0A8J8MUG1_9RHOB|nr:HesA/MoeB/ThiF family protein [Falsirhodobacter algicola]QUS36664.1 molybdopterin biosynthesis protein [Falsirhodobacter algicola]